MKAGKASAAVAGVRAGIQAGAPHQGHAGPGANGSGNGSGMGGSRREALAQDPLSADDILTGFYRPAPRAPGGHRSVPVADHRPLTPVPPGPRPVSGHLHGLDGSAVHLDEVLTEEAPGTAGKKVKPTHYKIVCISLYVEDIARLDSLVAELKRRGHTKANKSQVIRAALEQIDLDKVPKAH